MTDNPYITTNWSRDAGDDNVTTVYELRGEVQWGPRSYDFDISGVFVNTETGQVYYAEDSGCSCPSPWEYTRVSALTEITRVQDWIDHTESRLAEQYYDWSSDADEKSTLAAHGPTVDEVARVTETVATLLRNYRTQEERDQ